MVTRLAITSSASIATSLESALNEGAVSLVGKASITVHETTALPSSSHRRALAGPTPESAYYVHVGLGTTMTTQDILEGRMIVEIGIAAVRPAEFIILRFSHKLQEA